MSEEYLKAIPDPETGLLHFVMDQAGFELFERQIARAVPARTDSPANFNAVKDRISGAFMAGGIVMGWRKRK